MHSLLSHPAVTFPLPGGDYLLSLSLIIMRSIPKEAEMKQEPLHLCTLPSHRSPEEERQTDSFTVLACAVAPSPQLLLSLKQSGQPAKTHPNKGIDLHKVILQDFIQLEKIMRTH